MTAKSSSETFVTYIPIYKASNIRRLESSSASKLTMQCSGTLHPGKVLRGSLPLLSPRFLDVPTFHHQVPPHPPQRERSQRRKWKLWARMLSSNFAEMTTSTPFRDLLHSANLQHGTECIDILLCKFYITIVFCFMTSVIQQIYCILYYDYLHILGFTCKWIYGNKYMNE